MRGWSLTALMVCILFAGCSGQASRSTPATEGEIKAELKKLEGKWGGSTSVTDGESKPIPLIFIDFSGDAFVYQEMDLVFRKDGKVKIEPNATPKTLDMVFENTTLKYIYKLEGDKLTICQGTEKDQARPKDFTGEKGTKQQLMTFTRFVKEK